MSDRKIEYGASAALTLTLASLAASSTLVTGRQSTVINHNQAGQKYLDYLVGGKITTGTAPTAGIIEVWAFGSLEDTPTFPDAFSTADAARTVTSVDIKVAACALLGTLVTDTTANRTYWFGPVSLALAFSRLTGGGLYLPKQWGVFVTHSTVAALHATAGNHAIWATPVWETIV